MQSVLELVGKTPLLELEKNVFAKLESVNPSGSIKDIMVKFMLEQAEKRGELKKGNLIVEATSGNTGISLAMIGKLKGYRVKIFMPHYMSEERKKLIRYFGAELEFADSMEEARQKAAEEAKKPGVFLLNQFKNADNVKAHELVTGKEILKQLKGKKIDFFVAGIGTGGTLIGAGKALRKKFPKIKLIGVLPESAETNKIEGIGYYYQKEIVDEKSINEIVKVSNETAMQTARELAQRFGLFVGISSGANFAVARKLKGTVVTVLPDSANRYLSTALFGDNEGFK